MKEGTTTAASTSIQIRNEERSWEMFYAFVVGPTTKASTESTAFTVQPWVGQLAPRGGVNQFSDTAIIEVCACISGTLNNDNDSWLVVGTR